MSSERFFPEVEDDGRDQDDFISQEEWEGLPNPEDEEQEAIRDWEEEAERMQELDFTIDETYRGDPSED